MWHTLKHAWQKQKLPPNSPYLSLYHNEYPDELVSFDCETTSLNVKEAHIISIGAVKIKGDRILTDESFYVLVKPEGIMSATNVTIHGLRPKDLKDGLDTQTAIRQFLDFVGGRTLVGYFLKYDVAMVNKFLKPMSGITLPQKQIEVSTVYHHQERRRRYYETEIDLRMATMVETLGIPDLPRHDALNDSINVAMMYLMLKHRRI